MTALYHLHNSNITEYRCAMHDRVVNPENKDYSLWIAATAEKAGLFSAVASIAKKQSQKEIPIGIIVMACGNTRAEWWIDQ